MTLREMWTVFVARSKRRLSAFAAGGPRMDPNAQFDRLERMLRSQLQASDEE